MVAQVEARGVEFARLQHDKDAVVAAELPEGLAATVVVQAEHVAVEPYLTPTERRRTTLLERDLVDLCSGEDVAERGATLDQYLAEILLEDERLLPQFRLEDHLHCLRLTVWIGAEIKDA